MAREYDPESFDRTTTVCTSDRSGFPGLRVTIHDLPCAGILRLPASQQRGYATEALCRPLMEETEAGCPRGGKYFAELASALAVVVLDQIRATPGSGPPQTHYRVNQALKILETRYQSSLTVQTLARAVDLSPYHFTRVFRQHTGVAPYRYLIRLRLEHARRMMLQQRGKPSLVDVALASGFYDQTPFSRHFRHAFGVTPGEFLTRSKEASVEKGAL